MQNAQQQQYLKVQVETASPGELTLLLYQEMVKSLLQAKRLYSLSQYEDMNQALFKVKAILSELLITLNMDYDIAKELHDLYSFYNRHLAEFMIKREVSMLEDVLEFARGMAETWKLAIRTIKTGA
ncbi:flagellar export chaperone FliS [Paenibacillus sp. UMB4589-SE434]|uniref:flagellar export chaperone FliS n=1 Tax=Paenibacillus sp. UMB4589-SE434 TaxID=3046314 RepID=UPI00254BD0BF|nr:flagellar export chaperone FliS [Paenibacillus sp. UMB4589-SE434]